MDKILPERLIDAIYDAALDRTRGPRRWAISGGLFGGVPTQLAVWDLATGTVPLGIGIEFADGVWEIARHYATPATNPTLAIAMRVPLHRAIDQGATIGFDRFKSLAVHADLYRPQGIMPFFGTVVARSKAMSADLL